MKTISSTGQLGSEEHLQADPGGGLHQVRDTDTPGPGQGDSPAEHGGQEDRDSHTGKSEDHEQDIGYVITVTFLIKETNIVCTNI